RLIVEHREVGLNRRMLAKAVHRRPTGAPPAFAGRRQIRQRKIPMLANGLIDLQKPKPFLGCPVAKIDIVPVRPTAARVLEPAQRGKCLASYAQETGFALRKGDLSSVLSGH